MRNSSPTPVDDDASASVDGLSAALSAMYSILLIVTAIQLARIVYNRQHKTISFQSGFLFLCFCWTFFRALLFIAHTMSPDDDMFDQCSDDVIFTAPVPIQCFTYSLLIFFFAWNVNKATWASVKRRYVVCAVLVNVAYLCWWIAIRSVVCAAGDNPDDSQMDLLQMMLQSGLVLNGCVFVTLAVLLAWYGYKISKMPRQDGSRSAKKSVSVCGLASFMWGQQTQVLCMTLFIWLVFTTRAIDDFISLDPDYLVYLTTPMSGFIFARFLLWEIFPTSLVLFHFRTIPPRPKFPASSINRTLPNRGFTTSSLSQPLINGGTKDFEISIGTSVPSSPTAAAISLSSTKPRPVFGSALIFENTNRYESLDDHYLRSK